MKPSADGRMLGRYQLLFMLGQGGMGEVHLARLSGAAGFEKLCIVKTVLPQLMGDQNFIDRFHHEARVLVQLTHSNIAQVYDMGEVEGTLYMAIEYVPGVDLSRVETRVTRQRTVMPVPMAVYIAQQICEALGYAHRKVGPEGQPLGIVHRDVSPQNVMVSYEGEVKVIDFGLAKSTARSKQTLPSTVMGKLGYMSPEQALARPVDHRSDIFSAGIVVWEMLAGRSMYQGGTMPEMVARMAMGDVPSLIEARPDISPTLDAIVMRALAKDPGARYQRSDDFARALNELAVREQMTVGAEDVGNYVRAMCPEEFAAERQLQSQLSMLRKQVSAEVPQRDPAFEGTLVRPSQQLGGTETPSGQQMTPAQRAMSMAVATPLPPAHYTSKPSIATARMESPGSMAPTHKSLAPVQGPAPLEPSGSVLVAPRDKTPFVIVGLFAFIALVGSALGFLWLKDRRDDAQAALKPAVQAPVEPTPKVAVAEPPPREEPPPKVEPEPEPVKVEPKSEPVVLDTIAVDGKLWKVLRKGDEDLIMLDAKDRLREGDRLNLVGEPQDDGKRPVYARAAVLGVNGSIAKLVFDEDGPMPDKLFASRDASPRPVAVVRRDPKKTPEPEPVKAAEPVKTVEPVKQPEPEPEPVKVAEPEPVKAAAPVQLFGSVRLSIPNLVGNRAVILKSQNAFSLSNCEVRLPSNVVFRLGKRLVPANAEHKIAFNDFRPDSRPPDPQFKADWTAVYCREGTGYWKTTYDRR